jgi:hypothetical protein
MIDPYFLTLMNPDELSHPTGQSTHPLYLSTRHYLSLLFIAIFGTYYYSIIHGDFIHLDDITLVTRLMNEPSFILKDLFFPNTVTSYYRPIIELSYRLDYLVWFTSASGWHLTNVVLHAMNTGLVYLLARALFANVTGESEMAAFCSALLYGINPLTTEAVCWVSGRSELILAFFMFFSFYLYLLFRRKRQYLYLLLSGLLYFCAALTKETALTLPLVVIALEYILTRENLWEEKRQYLPAVGYFLLLTAVYFLLFRRAGVDTAGMHIGVGASGLRPAPVSENILVFFASLGYYVRKILFPYPLNFAIDSINLVLYAALGLGVLVLFTLRVRLLPPVFGFFAAWMLIIIAPAVAAAVLHLPLVQWAERYLYVPLAGFSMALGLLFTLLNNRHRYAAVFMVVLLTGLFWAITLHRTYVWADECRLWEDTARKSDYGPVHHFYGKSLLARNNETEGIEQMKKAIARGYRYYPYLDLSFFAFKRGDYEESEAWLHKALHDFPQNSEIHLHLAELYITRKAGKAEGRKFLFKAIDEYVKYVAERKNDGAACLKIAQLYKAVHQEDRAVPFLERTIAIDSTSPAARIAVKYLQKYRKGEMIQ